MVLRQFFVSLPKNNPMLSKQRIPDLIFIAVLGLLLTLLNYTGQITLVSDYPFIFMLATYFVGRAVTWYIINKHMDNSDESN
jgi:hypothetical protein